ncbi:MAG: NADPH:quinone reductase [Planctomycetaceae bacterium]|nr:NADPH:quinone reductase [Planctomycetaceae bacterium]
MQAAFIQKPGPAESLQYGSLAVPAIGPQDLLVRVGCSAINPIDTYIRSGMIAMGLPSPYIPGCDFAGTVLACGAEVTRFQPGDRVWGSNQGLFGHQGTLAEQIAVPEAWAYPTPDSVTDEQAAAGALVSLTAAQGLFLHSQIRSGETLFVNGGSGGVGAIVVQMAKACGARVLTTAGSAEKQDYCRSIGADVVFDHRAADLDQQIQSELEQNGKIDFWWETLRTPNIARTIPWMNKRGRIIVMAGREAQLQFPLGPFYVNDLKLIGFAMFNASAEEQQQLALRINQMLENGSLKIPIGKRIPLSEAATAHQLQEGKTLRGEAEFFGKIVVIPELT